MANNSNDPSQKELAAGLGNKFFSAGRKLIHVAKKKWMFALLPVAALFFLIIVLIGSGMIAVLSISQLFSSVASFRNGESSAVNTFQESDLSSVSVYSAEELLMVMDEGFKPDPSVLDAMRLDLDTFKYLLNTCYDYESRKTETRTITIQGFREYKKKVSNGDPETDTDPDYETAYEYPTKEITVSNQDTEGMLALDWRLLYVYALFNSMDDSGPDTNFDLPENDTVASDNTSEDIESVGYIRKEHVDRAFSALSMQYEYSFDVMTDERDYYSFDESQSVPHVEDITGDPDTSRGQYTYYYPHSLFSSATSGYSKLYYVVDGEGNIQGLQELFVRELYDVLGPSISNYYSHELMDILLHLTPGGSKIAEQFDYYLQTSASGNCIIYNGVFTMDTGSHSLPSDLCVYGTPGLGGNYATGGLPGNNGMVYNQDTALYPNPKTVGEAAVNLALSRLDWQYSQARRGDVGYWDCSSLIARCYNELGVDINPWLTTYSLKTQAYAKGQIVPQSEMQAGDVFWLSGSTNHVVMYCGNGMVVHAVGAKYGTKYQDMQSWLNSTSKKLEFCFRPYKGLASSWEPTSAGTQASVFKTMTKSEAVDLALALAVNDAKACGLLPSVTAAQFILESGYGTSSYAQRANNFFGIKYHDGKRYPGSPWDGSYIVGSTGEVNTAGEYYIEEASFRLYDSVEDSVADHSAFVLNNSRYSGILNASSYQEACQILEDGGYATDPKYAENLCSIIERYNLNRYDSNYRNVSISY